MKIIQVDNFDRETVDDVLVCENVNSYYGNIMVDFLNERFSGETSANFYKLVEDGYVLYKYEW
jgi:hypothetical protein